MQSVFNRERNKFRNSYESWKENGPPGGYNYIPRDDWYWQTDTPNSEKKNKRTYTPAGPRGYPMSHHYTVLGLDRSRGTPYTDAEVKVLQSCHPIVPPALCSVYFELVPPNMIVFYIKSGLIFLC
uniref:Uncharacterized protein n=1 Tax=Triticum urartu TaxID=4572 RepID=A0A8R7RCD5_TRIUA